MTGPELLDVATLLELDHPDGAHGYAVTTALLRRGLIPAGTNHTGATYRRLRRLEEAGLVVAEWYGPERGPAQRRYRLTALGREHLRDAWPAVRQHLAAIDSVYRRLARTLAP